MAKVIPLNKCLDNTGSGSANRIYITAAWHLSLAALWPFENVKPAATKRCKNFLTGYLLNAPDIQAAFRSYCERILLYSRILSASPSMPIEPPAIWLNPGYKDGFAGTGSLCRLAETSRLVRPVYQEGITVLADGYCQYLRQPSAEALSKLHTRLSRLKQYSLLQLLSHVVLQQILSTKQRV